MSAMDYAVMDRGSVEVANCLLQAGAKFEGKTLSTALVKAVSSGDIALLRRYVKYADDEAVLKATDKDGRSLVHIALALDHIHQGDILEFLLQLGGGGLNEVDFFGNDLVHEAQRRGKFEVSRETSPGRMQVRDTSPGGGRRYRVQSFENIDTYLTLSPSAHRTASGSIVQTAAGGPPVPSRRFTPDRRCTAPRVLRPRAVFRQRGPPGLTAPPVRAPAGHQPALRLYRARCRRRCA